MLKSGFDVSAMEEKVKIVNLKKSFGERVVFSGIDLSINSGEILCIIGKSGSGKSVLLKNLIGLLSPDEGDIFVDGVNFTGADEKMADGYYCFLAGQLMALKNPSLSFRMQYSPVEASIDMLKEMSKSLGIELTDEDLENIEGFGKAYAGMTK